MSLAKIRTALAHFLLFSELLIFLFICFDFSLFHKWLVFLGCLFTYKNETVRKADQELCHLGRAFRLILLKAEQMGAD